MKELLTVTEGTDGKDRTAAELPEALYKYLRFMWTTAPTE
jgi:hypothetical protein